MADIKAQLQQAHALIKEKKFQQAKRLLAGIDHPLAEEWRAKIETLLAQEADKARAKALQSAASSPAVEPDRKARHAQKPEARPARPGKSDGRSVLLTPEETKAHLIKAGELMKRQQYDEARAILETLDHPKATEWLARLDNIAPKDAPLTGINAPALFTDESPAKLKQKPLDVPLPDTPPEDPFGLMPRRLGGAPFALFNLASNWNRLGKTGWGTMTTIVGAVIFLALLASGAFWLVTFKAPVIPIQVMYGLMLGLAVANLSFPYMIAILQSGAYKRWQQGDVRGMLDYRYPAPQLVGGWVALMGVTFIVTNIVGQNQFAPRVFDHDKLTFSYPAAWSIRDLESTTFCQELDVNQHCLFRLTRGGSLGVILMNDLDTSGYDLNSLDEFIWRNLASAGYSMDGTITALTIDSHPAILRRYYRVNNEGYEFQLLVLHSNQQQLLYFIGAANSKAIMDERWHEIEQMIESLDFHDNDKAA